MTTASVMLWGSRIGAVTLPEGETFASFQYDADFLASGIEVAPLTMPLGRQVYRFPALPPRSFHGLPGLLADSLPDKYGTVLIDAWLATQGRPPGSMSAVERLCYTGPRGMGALEFRPNAGPRSQRADEVQIDQLVKLASEVLTRRDALNVTFAGDKREALREILRVGTSAGGARAKAIIAWNPETNDVRSGQVRAPAGYEYWLIKFDGVAENKDHDLADPFGYGAVEFAYSRMAAAAGIEMAACRLFEEGGRRHFMTRRFDRTGTGEKIHMLSLAAIAHYDFNDPLAHSYEQAFLTMRQLRLPQSQVQQQFRRMVFNVVARNQDDHVKNIAFLMDRDGQWRLSPAYDVAWQYNPAGDWTSRHQMSVNLKRDGFTREDIVACASNADIGRGHALDVLEEVTAVVSRWSDYAAAAKVADRLSTQVTESLRLAIA